MFSAIIPDTELGVALVRAGFQDWETFRRTVGVTARTVRRWRRGQRLPAAVTALLAALTRCADLGELDRAWRGWRVVNGALFPPEDRLKISQDFTPREILGLPMLYTQIALYEKDIRLEAARRRGQRVEIALDEWRELRRMLAVLDAALPGERLRLTR